jgi:hypothetical protein
MQEVFSDKEEPRQDNKFHVLELGAGDFTKSVGLASKLAFAFDSNDIYGAFDYTATEFADVPEKRAKHEHHLVEQSLISTSRNRNGLDSIMKFKGGVDGTHLEKLEPSVKSDLILWQAPHTGVHGSKLQTNDPRQTLLEAGERFYKKNKTELGYPEKSTRGELSDLHAEVMTNIGLMEGLFNSAHHKISRQIDESGQCYSGKIALVVLNSIPFKGSAYMPTVVAEQYGWHLVQAGPILEYMLERTSTGTKIPSKTGASLLIFEESQAYLSKCSRKDFSVKAQPEKVEIEKLIVDVLCDDLQVTTIHDFPQKQQISSTLTESWNKQVTPPKPGWQTTDSPVKNPDSVMKSTESSKKELSGAVVKPDSAMDMGGDHQKQDQQRTTSGPGGFKYQ